MQAIHNDKSLLSPFSELNTDKRTKREESGSTFKEQKGGEFSKLLKQSINELNNTQEQSDKALADMATGQIKDLHQAAIAIGKAETSMKLMLEVRNKAISAYKELLRTQI
ncbi:flagellar hook-basal body complex protein FliE [Helicobacter pylori]|uniref:flagellar hook-basal body complex protein FliE n=1 Tax=Helicobacter pylori TaxID=210 RepID=UPI0019234387|nr:flagellar hook-basal body complex protein FliE [Helicobacter pylori]QQW62447.1 flagellar hook-basal body complex protein FliE [Helicobacter pylori]QQW63908.1 flagellar hook-basal body complex protein FliE [Helicobacter pylori]QQW68278.1 flagellar hook-basal body complex protein FliE [Helicobacter pylori]QQW95823.1 flagellar hook-basal body complex protein FliE [Helicobacter pylori]QQW98707.1 flagellar hook-basal body complex protein FliE [Helicobacter pylori]